MPKNEEGEFELILGNRQLLSVFFIVVVLLGVFFTMGYIVGRNNAPGGATDQARKTEPKTIVVERPTGAASENPPAVQPSTKETPVSAPPPQPTETKATEPPAAEKKAEPKTEAKAEPRKPEPRTEPEPASPTPGVPASGATYLQLAAIPKTEAQIYVDVLAKKGFHAIYAPVPGKASFRVLVGPFQNAAAVSQARADLTKAGLKGYEAIVRSY